MLPGSVIVLQLFCFAAQAKQMHLFGLYLHHLIYNTVMQVQAKAKYRPRTSTGRALCLARRPVEAGLRRRRQHAARRAAAAAAVQAAAQRELPARQISPEGLAAVRRRALQQVEAGLAA
jgi:hypothetical protein